MVESTMRGLFIMPLLIIGLIGVAYGDTDMSKCEKTWTNFGVAFCYLKLIIDQNDIIISQNEQILKNQEIIKCYELHKKTGSYGVFGDSTYETNRDKLVKRCGE